MFSSLIIIILVPICIAGLNAWLNRVVEKQNSLINGSDFQVKYNSLAVGSVIFLFVFFILCSALFPVLYLCDIPDGPPVEVVIAVACVFGVCAIVSGVFAIAVGCWKIAVSNENIIYVPLFGKSVKYEWNDINNVTLNVVSGIINYKVFLKGKVKKAFSFRSVMVGASKFAELLNLREFPFD